MINNSPTIATVKTSFNLHLGSASKLIRCIIIIYTIFSQFRISAQDPNTTGDSLALLKIYDAMGGETWTRKNNWRKGEALKNWTDVAMTDSRITGLSLGSNNLIGDLPADITSILGLTTIDLSGNAITSVPDFTTLPNLTNLNLSMNFLQFGDLEKNIKVAGFGYANQGRTGTIRQDTVLYGTNQTVSIITTGANNTFQWYFTSVKENVTETLIPGATESSYEIPAITYDNMGLYRVKINNPTVPNLTIEGRRQTILAYADVIFKGLDSERLPIEVGKGFALKY